MEWDSDWFFAVLAVLVIDVGAVIALTIVPRAINEYARQTRVQPPVAMGPPMAPGPPCRGPSAR
jgi:hypothetical protein